MAVRDGFVGHEKKDSRTVWRRGLDILSLKRVGLFPLTDN